LASPEVLLVAFSQVVSISTLLDQYVFLDSAEGANSPYFPIEAFVFGVVPWPPLRESYSEHLSVVGFDWVLWLDFSSG
jgi:hypothetical protein